MTNLVKPYQSWLEPVSKPAEVGFPVSQRNRPPNWLKPVLVIEVLSLPVLIPIFDLVEKLGGHILEKFPTGIRSSPLFIGSWPMSPNQPIDTLHNCIHVLLFLLPQTLQTLLLSSKLLDAVCWRPQGLADPSVTSLCSSQRVLPKRCTWVFRMKNER